MSENQDKHIVVVGAGVIGLQTAALLSKAGHRVTIVAQYFPGDLSIDYTSPWAGAHFRGGTEGPPFETFERETFMHWAELIKKNTTDKKSIGVEYVPAVYYWDEYTPNCEKLWWDNLVPNFRVLGKEELPEGVEYGVAYDTICINPAKYMVYLLSLIPNVDKIRCGKLEKLEDVFKLPELATHVDGITGVVNCTGLGSRELVRDELVFPTRGQTLLIKESTSLDVFRQARNKQSWYIVRRAEGGGTILGGSRQDNDWNAEADDDLTARIKQNCKFIAPKELLTANDGNDFDVVSVQVGRRPSRKGGVRIAVDGNGVEGKWLVHEYGHSGSGYQTSYGSAKETVKLVGLLQTAHDWAIDSQRV